ncbi:MAG TPA: hypothetical protein EYO61_03785 [Campylobacterales bacterium]|nr:hypothetical protein [Campylobacterales bacterium]
MEGLEAVRNSLHQCIEKEKEKLFQSNISFFLNSIQEEINEMERLGFSYKKQLEIINRASNRDIKYSTYIRYMKRKREKTPYSKRRVKRFKFEAMPNLDELY